LNTTPVCHGSRETWFLVEIIQLGTRPTMAFGPNVQAREAGKSNSFSGYV